MLMYLLIASMTFFGAVASIFLKRASQERGIGKLLLNVNLYLGLFLYGSAALINIVVLRFLAYSVVLPLTSITYIWTMILSFAVLHENITIKKILGVVCIVLGAVLVVWKIA